MEQQDQLLSMMHLTVALLHEANDRLHQLCAILPEQRHKDECGETAKQIRSHLISLHEHLAMLLREADAAPQ
ncbi:MAG: hypothetical protein H0X25_10730 [Acidobacteriales bacterium]|nr:hypothetical protein [Terriglobales bacterium]